MALFAYYEPIQASTGIPEIASLIAGIAMHGLCFGCWIFVAFMIVDEQTEGDVRASAQSLFNFVILGIGIIVGSQIAGWASDWAGIGTDEADFTKLFEMPMYAALVCFVLLLLMYPSRSTKVEA